MRILPAPGLQERLLAHLREIVRERDPEAAPDGHAHVQAYISEVLAQFGQVRALAFEHLGRVHHNLVAELPGQEERPFILVGAHVDAVAGSPGADDNGSALAVLLELARAFSAAPARHPLRLIAFDLEECEQQGSRAYANALKKQGERPRLVIALEMLGYRDARPGSQKYPAGLRHFYPDRGDFIALIGNLRTLPMLPRLARNIRAAVPCEFLAVPCRGRVLPDSRRSDHAPFWDLGYPAIMVTDTANMRNPHYHRPSDRIETLDLDFLAAVCTGLAAGLRAL
jgi:Zn-dependent M28 family amino/carboxypeptidase